MSNGLIFQIPFLLEVSGNVIIFSEAVDQDLFNSHLVFDISSSGHDISASQLEDIFLLGNTCDGALIFFARADTFGGDQTSETHYVSNLTGKLAKLIVKQSKLIHNDITSKRVPIGPAVLGQDPSQNYYSSPLTTSEGDIYSEVFLKILSTHLLGNPMSRAFIKSENAFKDELESDTQIDKLATQFNEILGGDISGNIARSTAQLGRITGSVNISQDSTNGVVNNVLQSFYEQMVADIDTNAARRAKFQNMTDSSGILQNDQTFVNGMPFLPNDKIVIYIRNKLNLAIENVGGSGNSGGAGYTPSINVKDVFPGGAIKDMSGVPATGRWGWMGFETDLSNNGLYGPGLVTQQTTDISGNGAGNIFDAHVWKLTLTLV